MRWREFITFIVATLTAYPLTVGEHQNARARRVAVLIGVEDDAEGQTRLSAFRRGMHDLGWSEGVATWLAAIWLLFAQPERSFFKGASGEAPAKT